MNVYLSSKNLWSIELLQHILTFHLKTKYFVSKLVLVPIGFDVERGSHLKRMQKQPISKSNPFVSGSLRCGAATVSFKFSDFIGMTEKKGRKVNCVKLQRLDSLVTVQMHLSKNLVEQNNLVEDWISRCHPSKRKLKLSANLGQMLNNILAASTHSRVSGNWHTLNWNQHWTF